MSKQTVALLTFGTALVASVATSPIEWSVGDEAEGAPFTVDATTPSTSLRIGVDAEGVEDAYDRLLTVQLEVQGIVDAEGGPLTLDFALVEETARGTLVVDRIDSWTLQQETEENLAPELVYLEAWDASPDGTYRVDVTMTSGTSADIDWSASIVISGGGSNEAPPGANVELTLDPADR